MYETRITSNTTHTQTHLRHIASTKISRTSKGNAWYLISCSTNQITMYNTYIYIYIQGRQLVLHKILNNMYCTHKHNMHRFMYNIQHMVCVTYENYTIEITYTLLKLACEIVHMHVGQKPHFNISYILNTHVHLHSRVYIAQ